MCILISTVRQCSFTEQYFSLTAANKDGSPHQGANHSTKEVDPKYKDWVFINYTYKRFEGLTQRGRQPFPNTQASPDPLEQWHCSYVLEGIVKSLASSAPPDSGHSVICVIRSWLHLPLSAAFTVRRPLFNVDGRDLFQREYTMYNYYFSDRSFIFFCYGFFHKINIEMLI